MKKIAVIACGMSYYNQKEFIRGVIRYGKEQGINIYVFTCYADYMEAEEYKIGAFGIYNYINLKEYDGVILLKDTIHYKPVRKRILSQLKKSKLPVISVDAKIEGMGYIGVNNYRAMSLLVNHVIGRHGKKQIAYINGPLDNEEGIIRAKAYCDVLKKRGIPFDSHWFFQGDFSIESGMYAVKEFERMNRIPQAIICANDNMAAGAIMELQEKGYRVPEDVIVTGFNNSEVAKDNAPCISTVDTYREGMGYEACQCVATMSASEMKNVHIITEAYQIYSESCGCKSQKLYDTDALKQKIIRRRTLEKHYGRSMSQMFTKFMSYDEPEEIFQEIRKFVPELKADYFYIGFRNTQEILEQEKSEKHMVGVEDVFGQNSMPLIYEKGAFSCCESLEQGQILSKKSFEQDAGSFYFIMPIHYQEQVFGYCVLGNCELTIETDVLDRWLMHMGICIENVLKKKSLHCVMKKLDCLSSCDGLTGLYNRIGFHAQVEKYTTMAKTSGRNLFMSFMDIDGLKRVNDTYGHQEGDRLIKTVANCLKEVCSAQEICMRFGGDEFVVLGLENVIDGRHIDFEKIFKDKLQKINQYEKRGYLVSASIGSYVIKDIEHTNLQMMMDKADTEMYTRKQTNKKKNK